MFRFLLGSILCFTVFSNQFKHGLFKKLQISIKNSLSETVGDNFISQVLKYVSFIFHDFRCLTISIHQTTSGGLSVTLSIVHFIQKNQIARRLLPFCVSEERFSLFCKPVSMCYRRGRLCYHLLS